MLTSLTQCFSLVVRHFSATSGNIASRGKLGAALNATSPLDLLVQPLVNTGMIAGVQPNRGRYKPHRSETKLYYDKEGNPDIAVSQIPKRFKRLRSGIFIHPIPGRHSHLYRKPQWLRERLKDHIFTSQNDTFLFDNMINAEWRAPKYYPEDPYEPYHTRTGVPWDYKNKKRRFYP